MVSLPSFKLAFEGLAGWALENLAHESIATMESTISLAKAMPTAFERSSSAEAYIFQVGIPHHTSGHLHRHTTYDDG